MTDEELEAMFQPEQETCGLCNYQNCKCDYYYDQSIDT